MRYNENNGYKITSFTNQNHPTTTALISNSGGIKLIAQHLLFKFKKIKKRLNLSMIIS